MTATCPSGHSSDEADYCSVCGAAIVARASTPGVAVAPTPLHGAPRTAAGSCPVCGEPRGDSEGRFCEVCRYDFVAKTGGGPPVAPAQPAPPAPAPPISAPASPVAPPPATIPGGVAVAPAAPPSRWLLVLTIDPTLDTDPDPAMPPPTEPERVFAVEQAEMLVGRRDDRQHIRPAVPLHDPGASRRHAEFLYEAATGIVSLHDLASTNGTKLNGEDVVSGSIRPLKEGDEVTIGRWTRIRLKVRP